jgi:tetratricopeptide (TPR) repeat protein
MNLRPLFVLLAASAPVLADLPYARELLKTDAAKAVEYLNGMLAKDPGDPWLLYDAGVAAYAAKDFAKADEVWQQLAASALPDGLADQVWLQIGNVSYRLVQPQIESQPDAAVARLEQSREAFRVALAFNKRSKTAAQNLVYVEKELEKVYARLARQLVAAAKKDAWDREKTIERLQAALTYAQQAQALNPKSPEREAEKKEIEKLLAEALDRKAEAHERTADQRNQNNEWERQNAQEELQKALDNFQQAQAVAPEDEVAKEGEKRVQEKLANSFNKAGRQEQQQARQEKRYDPQQAVETFEKALEDFQQALAHKPEHADAQAGEKEVKQELEQLHLDQGDRQAQRGEEQMERAPEQAAENLLGALENFEQAKGINPENEKIQPRIDKVESQLAPLLTQLGQQEQKQGERAEQQDSPGEAMAHLEKAESSFEKAQQLEPGNEPAKQGQQQVQAALSRLRQQMAKRNQPPGKPQPGKAEEAKESFESMLAKLKEDMKPLETRARHHAGQKYDEDRNKNLRNW